MASWMVHLRVADKMIEKAKELKLREFIVGNVAPDCGVPNEDWTCYIPDKSISHYEREDENGNKFSDYSVFQGKFINDRINTEEEKSFYLGYYTHLLTDVLWGSEIYVPSKLRFSNEYGEDKKAFLWKLKKDWYDLDHLFLKKNKSFRAFRIYESAKGFENKFMEEFPKDAFSNRLDYIVAFYKEEHENLFREYTYLTEKEMDDFVELATEYVLGKIKGYI